MASCMAWQLVDDYEDLLSENDYGSENMFDLLEDADCTHETIEGGDLYKFTDGSTLKLNGNWYHVEGFKSCTH